MSNPIYVQLQEARAAYHALMTGTAVVEFRDQNGETVKYGQANANKLAIYIQELERKLGLNAARGPMEPWF